MAETTADILIATLEDWGVELVLGISGDGVCLATPGQVLVEALVDPFEPPPPAKITLDQAAKFATALVRGEPNREKIALTVLGDRVRELV